MKTSQRTVLLALLGTLVVLLPACTTNTQGDDANPVFLTAEFTLAPLSKNVNDGTALQIQTITLRNRLKGAVPTTTQFLDIQCDSYTVVWTRIDGGKTASPPQSFGCNVIVPFNSTSTLNSFPVMSAANLVVSPLDRLFPFNGGFDPETGKAEIRQTATATFYGHLLSGQAIASIPATLDMIFNYVPKAGRVETSKVSRVR
jgi:hypothetical protein